MATQVSKAVLVRLEALPGKEDDVRGFLNQGLSIVEGEPGTVRWFGIQFGPSSFGIFDAFPDDDGRQAHLSGAVAQALSERTGEFFEEPTIELIDVVVEKQPA
ncbi:MULTISPECIES: putative quinol monooxygenase [Streptomyces]|uniref:Antibiotic biosynthesis monooxygenase n=1 Tax=Streptomyces microflavus TaxID=1919 RepID=A0ABV1QES5_STRMI|nr:antibiotic biosynthesis monooxygenase [Streptomyces sp. SID2119]MYW32949.1 antibiotic biosynthesis monooxygenase [Streptomyces sp. SID2119]